jgi:hypothetical protein
LVGKTHTKQKWDKLHFVNEDSSGLKKKLEEVPIAIGIRSIYSNHSEFLDSWIQ